MSTALCYATLTFEEQMPCNRCHEWTTSVETVLQVLSSEKSACEGCGRQSDMRIVAEQYRKRRPRWWIVGSTVVVPIWIVETLRTRKGR